MTSFVRDVSGIGEKSMDCNRSVGAVVVISNPQAIKMIKPLFNSADSVIIQPVVAFVNGSR